jgi:hypothetical protein
MPVSGSFDVTWASKSTVVVSAVLGELKVVE